jgi:hypothetical protein
MLIAILQCNNSIAENEGRKGKRFVFEKKPAATTTEP